MVERQLGKMVVKLRCSNKRLATSKKNTVASTNEQRPTCEQATTSQLAHTDTHPITVEQERVCEQVAANVQDATDPSYITMKMICFLLCKMVHFSLWTHMRMKHTPWKAKDHINRSQILIVGILMLISIPCLLMVSYVHFRIRELRTLHGMTLSIMSACLATGYFLYSLVHLFKLDDRNIGYAVQFFVLSYYFWFFCLCCNVCCNIWIHIALSKAKTKNARLFYMGIYSLSSFSGALVLVILTNQKGLPGMPSYFIQGYTESIRESQRYFIPPVSTLLLLSFFVMTGTFFGFQKYKSRGIMVATKQNPDIATDGDKHVYEEVKKDAKCISLLGLILISTWLLEIVTFYSPGPQIYLILMEMINGLQGVFVLLIFLVIRRRRTVIFRWWNDRGSYIVEKVELDTLN
ncbi:methuselah-like 14 isoform X3 [Musca autumnalis]|uniref:methuselah-like 14 isoform X3 n=1 Tax=Musca autumnalis TaxID=221902 RepID=UPI003CEF61EA